MRRNIALLCSVLSVAAVGAYGQATGGGSAGGGGAASGSAAGGSTAGSASGSSVSQGTVPQNRINNNQGLPPGLQRQGQLPPGLDRRDQLPPGLQRGPGVGAQVGPGPGGLQPGQQGNPYIPQPGIPATNINPQLGTATNLWPSNMLNNSNLQRQRFLTNSGVTVGHGPAPGVQAPPGWERAYSTPGTPGRTINNGTTAGSGQSGQIYFGGNTNLSPTGRDQSVLNREDRVRAGQDVYDRENQVRRNAASGSNAIRPQVLQTNLNQAPSTR